jgi:choline dehydrogenase
VLANRLSRNPDIEVLLIEAGGKDDYLWIHIPVGYLYCIDNPRTDWRFRTEADPGLKGRALIYPRGKVLGGSSSINGMIYMRGQAGDYDRWAECPAAIRPGAGTRCCPCSAERRPLAGRERIHGGGGEWRVERQRLSWDILDAFRDAAGQTGIPPVADFNGGDNFGCAYFEVNQRRGIRLNTAKAFLRPASQRPNLTIMTGCHVERNC